ncbi:MAG: hypothetical protein U9R56_03305, partial [candidate division Zixibacteria bacterium]|nr:hypothetical protein [candidate division Zixibacteria bacterium]
MFGYRRGVGAGWLRLLESLEDEAGYRKSLIIRDRFAYADSLLASNDNIWKDFIDNWRLLSIQPYIVGVSPSAAMLTKESEAKENRLAGYIEGFRRKYEVTDEQEAIALYKEEFDAKTSELEALGGKDKLPGFIDNPPMTLDDQLNYKTLTLPDGIPMVASTFENMTSSKVGIAFRLDVIPESLLVYAPFLPTILTDIGVTKDGEIVPYDKMHERLRGEVLSLNAYFDHGFQTGRTEMILSGRGNNLKELKQALGWMDAALYSPYLSTENLPRMMDVIDQALISYRNRMKGSEESWVDYPARAYRFQRDPLILSTNCFLTEAHHYQRLKWMLTDPGSDQEQKELIAFLNVLEDYGTGKNRDELFAVLTTLEGNRESTDKATLSDPGPDLSGL